MRLVLYHQYDVVSITSEIPLTTTEVTNADAAQLKPLWAQPTGAPNPDEASAAVPKPWQEATTDGSHWINPALPSRGRFAKTLPGSA